MKKKVISWSWDLLRKHYVRWITRNIPKELCWIKRSGLAWVFRWLQTWQSGTSSFLWGHLNAHNLLCHQTQRRNSKCFCFLFLFWVLTQHSCQSPAGGSSFIEFQNWYSAINLITLVTNAISIFIDLITLSSARPLQNKVRRSWLQKGTKVIMFVRQRWLSRLHQLVRKTFPGKCQSWWKGLPPL